MKLYFPELGSILTLEKSWEFNLYHESRNSSLIPRFYDGPDESSGWTKEPEQYRFFYKKIILPPLCELKIDRIYIRKGFKEFSSISFFLNRKTVDPDFSKFAKTIADGKGSCRFWAKLEDVNNIDFFCLQS